MLPDRLLSPLVQGDAHASQCQTSQKRKQTRGTLAGSLPRCHTPRCPMFPPVRPPDSLLLSPHRQHPPHHTALSGTPTSSTRSSPDPHPTASHRTRGAVALPGPHRTTLTQQSSTGSSATASALQGHERAGWVTVGYRWEPKGHAGHDVRGQTRVNPSSPAHATRRHHAYAHCHPREHSSPSPRLRLAPRLPLDPRREPQSPPHAPHRHVPTAHVEGRHHPRALVVPGLALLVGAHGPGMGRERGTCTGWGCGWDGWL